MPGSKKGGFLKGVFAKSVRPSWLWRSECQMYCWARYPWVLFVSLAVTLDSTETPFAKTPFAWFLTNGRKPQEIAGRSSELNPKDPAVLKRLRLVNLLRVVNLLSHCDLLSRRTLRGHHFPGDYRHFPLRRSKYGGRSQNSCEVINWARLGVF